ncbi:MAG: redoxin domain-containing protein [Phycisphaera sp.]|nr:redoxin domain-containing protein [Phycisphaera sp.]
MHRRTILSLTATLVAALLLPNLAHTAEVQPLKKGDRVAFFGDSITQAGAGKGGYIRLFEAAVKEAHPDLGVEVIPAGISGHKVPDLQKRVDRDVISKKPTIVFIYIGINDVWHWNRNAGTKKEDYEAGLNDLIKRITDAGARVILCTPSVIGEKTDGSNKFDSMLEEYSDISRKVAKETDTQMLDLREAFKAYLKEHNTENKERGVLTRDSVHLNETGNRFVADQMLAAVGEKTGSDSAAAPSPALAFTMKDIDGKDVNLADRYKGKVVLMVNVASKCGNTPQYKQLEALHEKYSGKGLAIVGFPCNQFGGQEPGSAEDIKQFCTQNYGVKFDIMSKIEVNGGDAHPLYKYLTMEAPGLPHAPIKWNFEKFVVNRDGKVIARIAPGTKPDDANVVATIEKALAE